MKKSIEQILNDCLVGKTICNRNNQIVTIDKVNINQVGGNHLGSIIFKVNGKSQKEVIHSRRYEFNFTDTCEEQIIGIKMHHHDIIGLSVRTNNILHSNSIRYVNELIEHKKQHGKFNFSKAGKSTINEIEALISKVVLS